MDGWTMTTEELIDSKTPAHAYLEAWHEADGTERARLGFDRNDRAALIDEWREAQALLLTQSQEIVTLRAEVARLSTELGCAPSDRRNDASDHETIVHLKSEVDLHRTRGDALAMDLAGHKAKAESAEEKLAHLQREWDNLLPMYESACQRTRHHEQVIATLTKERDDARAEVARLEQQPCTACDGIEALKTEVAKLEASAEEDGAALNTQASRIRELAKECLDLRTQVESITSSRDHIMATYKELCGKYTEEKDENKQLVDALKDTRSVLDAYMIDLAAYRIALRSFGVTKVGVGT